MNMITNFKCSYPHAKYETIELSKAMRQKYGITAKEVTVCHVRRQLMDGGHTANFWASINLKTMNSTFDLVWIE